MITQCYLRSPLPYIRLIPLPPYSFLHCMITQYMTRRNQCNVAKIRPLDLTSDCGYSV